MRPRWPKPPPGRTTSRASRSTRSAPARTTAPMRRRTACRRPRGRWPPCPQPPARRHGSVRAPASRPAGSRHPRSPAARAARRRPGPGRRSRRRRRPLPRWPGEQRQPAQHAAPKADGSPPPSRRAGPGVMPATCTSDSRNPACTSPMPRLACKAGNGRRQLADMQRRGDAARNDARRRPESRDGSWRKPRASRCMSRRRLMHPPLPGQALVLPRSANGRSCRRCSRPRARCRSSRRAKVARHSARGRPGRRRTASRTTLLRLFGGLHHLRVAIEVVKQEALERARFGPHRGAEEHQRVAAPRRVGIGRRGRFERAAGGIDHVIDLRAQHAADRFVQQPPALPAPGYSAKRLAPVAIEQRRPRPAARCVISPERTPSSMSCAL